jgi:hypothetical protein
MVGMIMPEDSSFLPTGILPFNPLWHMTASPKHLSQAKVTTITISANRMARLEGNMLEGEAQQLKGDVEEIGLLILWPWA